MDIKIIRLESCRGVRVRYCFRESKYGTMLVAATDVGLCYMGFGVDVQELECRFVGAQLEDGLESWDEGVLHLRGTDFQLRVWRELLNVGRGECVSYGELANRVGCAGGARAVGSAVGRNPVSILVPCHRVVRSSGDLGGYYWGLELKSRILADEVDFECLELGQPHHN